MLASLKVRTSSRRWNRALLTNLFVYMSNFVWMKMLHRPLWRDFPIIRESSAQPRWHRLSLSFGLGALLLLLIWFGEGTFGPQGDLFGKTYWHGDTNQRVVALTFDDGPNEPYTSRVLDILKREHVRATFFLIGENIQRFRGTAARIVLEGHAVGNHSDRHTIPFAL